jgi:hypothetical protein
VQPGLSPGLLPILLCCLHWTSSTRVLTNVKDHLALIAPTVGSWGIVGEWADENPMLHPPHPPHGSRAEQLLSFFLVQIPTHILSR